ncbi:MAG: FkbM family methyltransferase [Candidatus Absconditicoccaceae bacterium]
MYGTGIGKYPPFKQMYHLHDRWFKKKYKGNRQYLITIGGVDLKIMADVTNSFLAKEVAIKGYYEKGTSSYFCDNIKKGSVFLDIGANIGYYSLIASKKVGLDGRVIAFEPVKKNYEALLKNIEINSITNVSVFNFGLGNKEETSKIHLIDSDSGKSSIMVDYQGDIEQIQMKKFDDLDLDFDKSKVQFIKIDVEGYEFEVLKGMRNLLQENRTLEIMMEFSPEYYKEFGKDYTVQFIDFIYELGFNAFDVDHGFAPITLTEENTYPQKNILLKRNS